MRAFQVAHFGASCDPIEENIKFAKKIEADYPLLSDTDKKVATAYGILSPRGYSKRVTFIIDVEGKIASIDDKIELKTHGADLSKKLEELKVKPAKKRKEKPKAS